MILMDNLCLDCFHFHAQFAGGKDLDLELVSCSGYGKNGALSVLQVLHLFIVCYKSHSQFDTKILFNVFPADNHKMIKKMFLGFFSMNCSTCRQTCMDNFFTLHSVQFVYDFISSAVQLFLNSNIMLHMLLLQRSVRPQVVTTFELPGCVDMWTVLSGDQVIDLVSMDYDDDATQCNAIQYNL